MYKTLIIVEPPIALDDLRSDFVDAGFDLVAELQDPSQLAIQAVRTEPDFVIAVSSSPSGPLFEAAKMLDTLAPCPFVVFSSDGDTSKIQRASDSGIHAYVVDGYAPHRLLSIIQVAKARFRHEQILRQEVSGISRQFEVRKLVDRAKGMLMRSRGVMEDEAFELLRSLSMRTRQRIGQVSQSVIDMANAGEAINRAGQLRMLSQRVVHAYAQTSFPRNTTYAADILADSIARIESNLAILVRSIGAKRFSELVENVAAVWLPIKALTAQPITPASVSQLDALSDDMLKKSENLTRFLESSGLVSSLHILNMSGRQRMISQKIIKLVAMQVLMPDAGRLQALTSLCSDFETALDFLTTVPLSNPAIAGCLTRMRAEWAGMRAVVDSAAAAFDPDALLRLSLLGERLLTTTEELVGEYERAMQLLIGDRVGYLEA